MATIEQYRSDLRHLLTLADNDLAALWRRVADANLARELLADILPELVAVYGSAAGTLAADWYDEAREAAEVRGSFRAIVAELPDLGRTDALAGWAVGPMFSKDPEPSVALVKAQGGLQRVIADVGRHTIANSSIEDPEARGWQRTGSGECAFCSMLIARGQVYSERNADFASHDHCHCAAVPAWNGHPIPVKPYTPSSRNITAADRARVRDYIRTH